MTAWRSIIHRIAAWLTNHLDILFAANRRFNPGENRLLVQDQALRTAFEEVAVDAEAAWTGEPGAWNVARSMISSACAARMARFLRKEGLL